MKFISNIDKTQNHLTTIVENFKSYKEVYIAVAFLKYSGHSFLVKSIKDFLKSGGQLTIIAGQNFALTEPIALHELRKIFETYPKAKLFLSKANSTTKVFHPKLYLFKNQKECCLISGSANITKGGLVDNQECSIVTNVKSDNLIWTDAKNYFDNLLSKDNADEATMLVIKQYETFFEQQKQHNKKAKSIPTKTKAQKAFDYDNLLVHFNKFNNTERQQKFKNKLENYKQAKIILDKIADNPRLTQKQFEPLLDNLVGSKDDDNLWHSGSLYRLRNDVYPFYKEFRELVRLIRENKNKPQEIVFEIAKKKVSEIKGAAVNYIAEIMMTYNERDFANLNQNPITVLRKEGGVKLKSHSSSFSPFDYAEYCELIKEISKKLGLRNMLEADSFFNDIYWKIKK